ncbi:MAG: signal peptidase I [Candidatus Zixiibacteriota bacterium]
MDNDFLLQEFQQTEVKKTVRRPVHKKRKPIWREYVEVIFISLAAAIVLRLFVVSAYRVDSVSMEDTLVDGDYIFVNRLAYDFGKPQIGDIIIFTSPVDRTKDYIKRVVALPGQTVEIYDKILYVDDDLAPIYTTSKNIDHKILAAQLSMRDNFGPVQVPEGGYFVLGDNRDVSQDSRFWGFVPEINIKGKAVMVYWSWEPDETAPEWSFPYIQSVFQIGWYFMSNVFTSTRWDRLLISL